MSSTHLLSIALLITTGCASILGLDEYSLSTCQDGVKGGVETDVDCGGPACTACANGRACKASSDCSSGLCVTDFCVAPTCEDNSKNGAETDVDCGGTACAACADGKSCADAADCESSVCLGGVCQSPICSDGAKNGLETDIDCGGEGACERCEFGKTCGVHEDCVAEGVCKESTCAIAHVWSKAFGDVTDQEATSVAFDPKSGDLLVAGAFNGTIDFGGPAPLMSAGSADVFLSKLDNKNGAHIWSNGFGDTEYQFGPRMMVDANGELVLGCNGFGTMNFGMGNLPSAGTTDIFVGKFNGFGGPLWHARYGDASSQRLTGVAIDTSGNLLLVGTFGGTIDFGGGALVATDSGDAFVASLQSSDGAFRWNKLFDASSTIIQISVAVDADGNVLIAGKYEGSVSFGGDVHTSLAGPDAFMVKFNEAGKFVWSKSWGSTGSQGVSSIAAAPDGDVYVAGTFEYSMVLDNGAVVMGQGGTDPFIAKLNGADGGHFWVTTFGDKGQNQQAQVVASDAEGNALVAGRFDGTLVFQAKEFDASGVADPYVAKFDSTGTLLWFTQGKGSIAASVGGLAVAPNGNVALAGSFIGPLSFGGEGLQSASPPGDVFVTMFSPP